MRWPGAAPSTVRRVAAAGTALAALLWLVASVAPSVTLACSPPFEEPTIAALPPDQVVVIGRIGELVPGGRHFLVDRWYHGDAPRADLVIAFKEGDPSGDCSYHPELDRPILIAPDMEPPGRLAATLGTLQATIGTEAGARYLQEAERLFGPGTVMHPTESQPEELVPSWIGPAIAVVLAVLGGAWLGMTVRGRRRPNA